MVTFGVRYYLPRLTLCCLVILGCTGQVTADVLYGVDGAGQTNSTLYTVNPMTGTATSIGAVTLFVNGVNEGALSIAALAYDAQTGTLYGATNPSLNANLPNATLVTLTTSANGNGLIQAVPVGQSFNSPGGGSFSMTALAFNASDTTLYGYAKIPSESLYTVSLSDGTVSLLGGSGISNSSGDGMAVNSSGTIYFAGNGASGVLSTLSSSNGAATAGPTLTGTPIPAGQIKGLAYDSAGDLYGLNIAAGSKSPIAADLVTINPSSGQVTEVGMTQNNLLALAFAPSPPASVPEPGAFTLLGLPAGGLLLWAALRRKRLVGLLS